MQLYTYLNYGGNCEQAFRFYEEHLGGKIIMLIAQRVSLIVGARAHRNIRTVKNAPWQLER